MTRQPNPRILSFLCYRALRPLIATLAAGTERTATLFVAILLGPWYEVAATAIAPSPKVAEPALLIVCLLEALTIGEAVRRGYSAIAAGFVFWIARRSQRSPAIANDAVLMDLQMPEMDGFEATVAIRDRERGSGTRVPINATDLFAAINEATQPSRLGEAPGVSLRSLTKICDSFSVLRPGPRALRPSARHCATRWSSVTSASPSGSGHITQGGRE